jgi:hypothetical protein
MARTDWIGQTLNGRYQIQELLGKGGMSAVYKAYDPNLRRVVAIKLIHQHLSDDPEFVRRFEEEAAAVAQLRHPNLIQVFDFTHDEGTYYIVFEFVPGETLQDRLKRVKMANQQMDIDEVIDITSKSADGLDYAHEKGLIHRDIKPANIIINLQGEPIVMDFGIAKIVGGTQHTATGAVLGTARYMSPEQIMGEKITPSTDFYSLGVVLYEMLGGRPPFEADSAMTLMMMHMSDPVPDLSKIRADVSPELVAVVNKTLAKDGNDRYQSGKELAKALRNTGKKGAAVPNAAIIAEMEPSIYPAPDATTAEPPPAEPEISTAGMAAVPEAAAAPAVDIGSSPTAPTPTAPPPAEFSGGSRSLMFGVGAAILLIIIAIGLWAVFFRESGSAESDGTITYTFDGRVYRLAAQEGATSEDVSQALDQLSPGSGDELLNISPDGEWLVLETERFDPECVDWACLALISADLSSGEAVRANGQVIHAEGFSAVSSGANLIVYSAGDGPHEIDLWAVSRAEDAWEVPLLLTMDSPYEFNRQPALSDDGSKLVFNCGPESFSGEGAAICEVGSAGEGFRVVLNPADSPAGFPTTGAFHHPDYAPDGSIVFEGDWDNEQIWRLSPGVSEPVRVTDAFGNDNSPCVLPDGRIVSLWLDRPAGTGLHEFKVMAPDGSNFVMVLPDVDVLDAGIGCAP